MCGYELGVILDIYDTPVYCVYLWIVLIWQVLVCSRFYRKFTNRKNFYYFYNVFYFLQGVGWVGASPSPHSHLVRWQSGNQSLLEAGLRSGSGCVGRFERVDCLRPGSGQF